MKVWGPRWERSPQEPLNDNALRFFFVTFFFPSQGYRGSISPEARAQHSNNAGNSCDKVAATIRDGAQDLGTQRTWASHLKLSTDPRRPVPTWRPLGRKWQSLVLLHMGLRYLHLLRPLSHCCYWRPCLMERFLWLTRVMARHLWTPEHLVLQNWLASAHTRTTVAHFSFCHLWPPKMSVTSSWAWLRLCKLQHIPGRRSLQMQGSGCRDLAPNTG